MEAPLANGFTFAQEVELCQIYWPHRYAAARTASSAAISEKPPPISA